MITILDLLQEHGVEYKQAGESSLVTHGWIGVVCPYCGTGTGKTGMGIHLEYGAVNCWKCGKHSLINVLHELTKQPYHVLRDIVKRLGRTTVLEGPKRGQLKLPDTVKPLYDGNGGGVSLKDSGLLRPHLEYLRSRNFDPAVLVRLWGIRGIGLAKYLAWRVFIPITWRGRTVSWTTRSIGGGEPKYIAAKPDEEELPLKSLLIGEEYARHAVIVVEGPFDAFRVGPGAVAVSGLSYTRAQVRKIAKYPLRVIAFDNESEAQRRAAKLCDELSVYDGKTVRIEIDAADPGSASLQEIKQIRKHFLE